MHDIAASSSQLASHLQRHGIQTIVEERSTRHGGVTNTLLAQAAEFGADLPVMGAYGHSPIWEFVVGGTTPEVLEKTTVRVLMSR